MTAEHEQALAMQLAECATAMARLMKRDRTQILTFFVGGRITLTVPWAAGNWEWIPTWPVQPAHEIVTALGGDDSTKMGDQAK